MPWSEASEVVAGWFDRGGAMVVEGVAVPRALRKWLRKNNGRPVDKVIYVHGAICELSKGQEAMRKGCLTVWNGIVGELKTRGVDVEIRWVTKWNG